MEAKKLRSMAVITMMLISLFSVKVSANQITNRQGDQLSLNLDETKETGLPTPAVQQGNGSNFGVPMHLLYEYLKIPLSYPNNRFRLLIVGGGLPINWTNLNTFQGRLTVTNLGATLLNDSEGRAASTGNEVEVLEYLLNNKFSGFFLVLGFLVITPKSS